MLRDEVSDLYCYTTGAICCAILFLYNLIQNLERNAADLEDISIATLKDLERLTPKIAWYFMLII